MRWITGEPHGYAGSGACARSRWSATPANGFIGHVVAVIQAMAAVKLTAVRPLGIGGGSTG